MAFLMGFRFIITDLIITSTQHGSDGRKEPARGQRENSQVEMTSCPLLGTFFLPFIINHDIGSSLALYLSPVLSMRHTEGQTNGEKE